MTDVFDEIKDELPEDSLISSAGWEGSEVVLYTKSRDFLLRSDSLIRKLAGKYKKRIDVRPDSSICKEPEQAKETINQIVPEDAGINEMLFQPEFGKVVIEAEKPGLVIGKGGSTMKEIKEKTLWVPEIQRSPPMESDVIKMVRQTMVSELDFRKKFLHKVGKRINEEVETDEQYARVTVLGAGRQVGRSCFLIQTDKSNVLLDCGVNTADEKHPYPYLQAPEFNMEKLDAVILSHAHLDHSGFISYLYEYGCDAPLYSTKPTRDMMALLALDFISVAAKEGKDSPYSTKGIKEALKRHIPLEYGEVSDIAPDMRLTLYNAGHILGSSMVHLHIGEGLHNLLYTGDIQYAKTKLYNPADTNVNRIETMIMEATYGASNDVKPSRREAENKLIEKVKKTIDRGGKVLIPSFAIGRAQEVMVILAEAGLDVPVYLDGMLWDATTIHSGYPEFLSKDLQKKIFHKDKNPFNANIFQRVAGKDRQKIVEDPQPCVILATSGMLEGGPVRSYLKNLADDPKSSLIFVGFQASGSLGRQIESGKKDISLNGNNGESNMLRMNMDIVKIEGLSGHADRKSLMNFFYRLKNKPEQVIMNHGEESKCIDMAKSLYKAHHVKTMTPKNLETIRLV